MGQYARLKHGSKELDLSSGDYYLLPEFTPPAPSAIPLLSGGSMMNKYSGGKRVDRSFVDRGMNLPLTINGDSASETNGLVRKLAAFIEVAMNDSANPLYFVFGESNAVPYEPMWGQQFKYYEVKDASQAIGNLYGIASIRDSVIFVNVPLLVAPLATGLRQRVGSATGGILEHTWGTPDGLSRGLILPNGVVNIHVNPVFGNSTWNTSWTDGANLTDTENTDDEFILFGSSSAKLSAVGADSTYSQELELVDATDYFLSYFVKLHDSGVVSGTHVVVFGEASLTTTYTSVGDGWYRISAAMTGTAAATETCGVKVQDGYSLILDGAQCEQKTYMTPFCYGDMLDVSWDGTAHGGTVGTDESTRTVSSLRFPSTEIVNDIEGTIRVVWKAGVANTHPTDLFFFDATTATEFAGYFETATDDFRFICGANTINSAASTFSVGDIIILHFVYKSGSMKIYRGGAEIASGSSFDLPSFGDYLYVGKDDGLTKPAHGTYLDLTTWGIALSAAEVLADSTNVTEHVTGGDGLGQRLNAIPWLWTDDGDNVLDYYTDATHENWCVYGGIPGNVPADTIFYLVGSAANKEFLMSNLPFGYYLSDYLDCFSDLSGHGDAGALGGEVEQIGASTSFITASSNQAYFDDGDNLTGVPAAVLASVSDAGSNLLIASRVTVGGSNPKSDSKSIVADATRRDFLSSSVLTPQNNTKYEFLDKSLSKYFVGFIRTTGTATIEVDYFQTFLGDFLYVISPLDTSADAVVIHNNEVMEYLDSTGEHLGNARIQGKPIQLHPNSINHSTIMLSDIAAASVTTTTVTITRVYVTPRWSIV